MPTPQPLPFGKTLATPRDGTASHESIVNLYPEQNPAQAKGPITLYGTPGLKSWLSGVGDGPIRAIEHMPPHLYVVSGNELYQINSSKTATLIGTVSGSGLCYTSNNGTHIWVAVVGGPLYAANGSAILDTGYSNMNGVTYQDGYLIASQAGTESFYISNLDDATTIDALDFSTADANPDNSAGIIMDHRELVIFGKETTEFWYNSGNASFPFERVGGGFVEHGCKAPGSVAKAENAVFMLSDDLSIRMIQGYQSPSITPPWVEREIEAVNDPSTAWGWTYRQQGHVFYHLGFSDLTLFYDITTQSWHKRKSEGLDRWKAQCHTEYRGKHIVGDYATGDLYELDLDTYDDDGDTIRRESTCPPLFAAGNRAITHELLVDIEAGQGLESGADPSLMLDWSDNGGKTWSNRLTRSAGKVGEYDHQARWNRLGAFRQRTYRIACSDAIKVAITGAYHRTEGLAS